MSEQRVVEVSGESVNDAIATGLRQLGVSQADVAVEVLDEGSKGLFGLGRRDARVRLVAQKMPAPKPAAAGRDAPATASPAVKAPPSPPTEAPSASAAPAAATATASTNGGSRPTVADLDEDDADDDEATPYSGNDQEMNEEEMATAVAIWEELLNHLQIDAELAPRLSEPDDLTGRQIPILDLKGRDLSILIGPRGETLHSLQFITRLMASHRMKRRSSFIIDVEGYRERRKQALARLAERMASKVVKRGKAVTLEPMPANERRAIHVALRDHEAVYTQSTGEGPSRRIRILPKR